MDYKRLARIKTSTEDGAFQMILATGGEASDGHILDIAGGAVPRQMPLLLSHQNDPMSQMGSVVETKRVGDELHATGQIELGGSGATADIRRDVFHMIQAGHVRAVSLRWDPLKMVARTELPKNHPAHIATDEPDMRKRYGYYFQKWRALEGSVVALGADAAAVIGRSQETTGEVAAFWRSMAADPGRVISVEEHETALAQIRMLEERIDTLSRPPVKEDTKPVIVPVDNTEEVARMVRAAIGTFESGLEERIRAYLRDTFGRVT